MGYSTIRDAIHTVLTGVAAVGKAYKYDRLSTNWADFITLFKDSNTINGWSISLAGVETRQARLGEKDRIYIVRLRGYYGLQDSAASENTFDDLVEDVVEAFDNEETLLDTCNTTHTDWGKMAGAVGLQVQTIEPRMFGNILCHYCEAYLAAEISF